MRITTKILEVLVCLGMGYMIGGYVTLATKSDSKYHIAVVIVGGICTIGYMIIKNFEKRDN